MNKKITKEIVVAAYPYMSKRFLLERFLGLTEGEIKENEDMWREEREDPELKVAGSDLRAVGINPGAMQTDIETGEEISQMEPAGVGTPEVGSAPAGPVVPGGVGGVGAPAA
jgi:hypothetical protein